MNELTESDTRVLHEALDDEYRSWATYDQVVADFGAVRPFIHIRGAEARHIEALSALFARYGLPLPANPWPGQVERSTSLQAACEAAAAAETANGALYERLLGQTQRADFLTVLRHLQQASQQRHLPAFQQAARRGAGGGVSGAGGGQGRGGLGARHRVGV